MMGAACSKNIRAVKGDPEISARFNAKSITSTPHSKDSTPFISSVGPADLDHLLPICANALDLDWKTTTSTTEHDAKRPSIAQQLDVISKAATETLSAGKSMVVVFDSTKLWHVNRMAAFSPMFKREGDFHEPLMAVPPAQLSTAISVCLDALNSQFSHHVSVVNKPYVRYFAGVPILSRSGHWMGVLGVFDFVPKAVAPTAEQEARLHALAAEAAAVIQQDMFEELEEGGNGGEAVAELPAVWVDVSQPDWPVVGGNTAWEKLTGVGLPCLAQTGGLLAAMHPADGSELAALRTAVTDAVESGSTASLPAILSPSAATKTAALQLVLALKPAPASLPPLPLPAGRLPGGTIWVAEAQARVLPKASSSSATSVDVSEGPGPMTILRSSDPRRHLWSSSSSSLAETTSLTGSGTLAVPPLVPPRLASLKLGPPLGRGSYGVVFCGMLRDSAVAVKIVEGEGADAVKHLWEAQFEAHLALELNHENIVSVLDWCALETGSVWIVQELCDLGPLSTAITHRAILREGRMPEGTPDVRGIIETALDIARGLRCLHHHGVIHSDLSSNNVLLVSSSDTPRGFVAKINDFGLSRLNLGSGETKTVGTVNSMAPELLLEGIMSPAADVYSFSVILWELWAGKRAWADFSEAQIIFKLTCRGEGLQPPEGAPPAYTQLAADCMAIDPSQRPSVDEIVLRLEAMLVADL